MKSEKTFVEGVVTESLPNTFFRVQLDGGNEILAHLSGKMRLHYIKVLPGDLDAFAQAIVNLSNHSSERNQIGKQAEQFIHKSYSWDYRARQVLSQIIS